MAYKLENIEVTFEFCFEFLSFPLIHCELINSYVVNNDWEILSKLFIIFLFSNVSIIDSQY